MTNQTDSLGSSTASLPSDNSSWIDLDTHETTGGRCHSGNSGTEREEGVEVLGGKSQETPAVPEDELRDFQCSSFGDDYEIIEVSDLNGMRIVGFSKQELLELCNFCKIGYGNNDKKLDSRYKTKAELINEGYGIIPFYYNERNIKCTGFVFTKDKEITIAYRGTQDFDDVITDVSTVLTSEILPEDGKMHNRFCNAFYDSLPSLSKILNSYTKEQGSEIKDFKINCTSHSMRAALATITALYLKKVEDAEYVRVATFGSPRVFDFHGAEIYEKLLGENTIRVTNSSDPIPMLPSGSVGFKHVGKPLKIKTGNFVISCFGMSFCVVGGYYHKTDIYYNCIQDIKPEDFQPDNNVSRYYYFSYVVAAPYCITTTVLTTPYYLFLSAISNTERHYFEKEMKFTDNQRLISLKDNKSGLVLGNAMVSLENPLIISYIEYNFNGRGEGLKFNIDDIASFVNSNYHLNRNNMRLRQLCEIKDVPNLIDAENYAPDGRNTVSGLVNEPATPGQVIDEAGSKQSQGSKPKSPDSQQPQENVDRRENIMNNKRGLTGELISNSFEEGEMHSSDQNTKSIQEALSDAIFDLNYKKVESLVEQVKQESNNVERIINWALEKANETRVGKKDKESKDKIKKIREFLAEELIAASLVGNDVKITASSHKTPVIESKESESDSLSSEGDDYSRFESGKSAGTSSGNGSPFEEVAVTSEMPSMATEEAKVNNEQSDNINDDDLTPVSSPVSGDVLTSRSNEEESVVITQGSQNDGKYDKAVSEEYQDDALEKDLIDLSSDDDNSLLGDPVPTSTNEISGRTDGTQTSIKQKEDSTPPLVPPTVPVSQKQGDVQPLPTDNENISSSNRQEDPCPASTPNPIPTPTLVPSVANNKSEQVNDTQTNGGLPNNSGKNNAIPQNTKSSKLPVIAVSALAVAGVVLGVAIAVYLEMLAAGIAVGACCLVAAVIIYCCNRPSSSFKDSNVELIADKELAATVN